MHAWAQRLPTVLSEEPRAAQPRSLNSGLAGLAYHYMV